MTRIRVIDGTRTVASTYAPDGDNGHTLDEWTTQTRKKNPDWRVIAEPVTHKPTKTRRDRPHVTTALGRLVDDITPRQHR